MKIELSLIGSQQPLELEISTYKVTEGGALILTPRDGMKKAYSPSAWYSVTELEKRRPSAVI